MARTPLKLVTLALTLCALALSLEAQGPPSPVRVSEVRSEEIQERRKVTGEVRSHRRARIAAEEPGWVIELAVREGQSVEKGDLLARLDSRKLELELEYAVAESQRVSSVLDERKNSTARARADLEALVALSERGAANPKELRDAEFESRAALARENQARHELIALEARAALLRERIEDAEVRAPWAGRVIAKLTEVGQWLAIGEQVVELVSMTELEAWLLVPQQYFGPLENSSLEIELRIDATGKTIFSKSFRSIPLIDARGRNFDVVADLIQDGRLAAGMSVTAWVPTGDLVPSLLVPRSAILRGETGSYVYVAAPGAEGQPGLAMMTPVVVTYSVGDEAVVQSHGLSAGTQVVTEGNERLYPRAPIIAMPVGAEIPAGESGQ